MVIWCDSSTASLTLSWHDHTQNQKFGTPLPLAFFTIENLLLNYFSAETINPT